MLIKREIQRLSKNNHICRKSIHMNCILMILNHRQSEMIQNSFINKVKKSTKSKTMSNNKSNGNLISVHFVNCGIALVQVVNKRSQYFFVILCSILPIISIVENLPTVQIPVFLSFKINNFTNILIGQSLILSVIALLK